MKGDDLSRKPRNEKKPKLLKVRKKCEVINLEVRQLKISTRKPDPWRGESIRRAQKEDPDIHPILELKEFSKRKPFWQDTSTSSIATNRYWTLSESVHIKDGVLNRKWDSSD